MRQVRLGQTDLQVSVMAFGTWASGVTGAPPILRKAGTPSITPWMSASISSTRHRATGSVSPSRSSARRCAGADTP